MSCVETSNAARAATWGADAGGWFLGSRLVGGMRVKPVRPHTAGWTTKNLTAVLNGLRERAAITAVPRRPRLPAFHANVLRCNIQQAQHQEGNAPTFGANVEGKETQQQQEDAEKRAIHAQHLSFLGEPQDSSSVQGVRVNLLRCSVLNLCEAGLSQGLLPEVALRFEGMPVGKKKDPCPEVLRILCSYTTKGGQSVDRCFVGDKAVRPQVSVDLDVDQAVAKALFRKKQLMKHYGGDGSTASPHVGELDITPAPQPRLGVSLLLCVVGLGELAVERRELVCTATGAPHSAVLLQHRLCGDIAVGTQALRTGLPGIRPDDAHCCDQQPDGDQDRTDAFDPELHGEAASEYQVEANPGSIHTGHLSFLGEQQDISPLGVIVVLRADQEQCIVEPRNIVVIANTKDATYFPPVT